MEKEIHDIMKEFPSPTNFILSEDILFRMTEQIEEKFNQVGTQPRACYEVILSDNKHLKLKNIQALMEHGNTVKNPIKLFVMKVDENGEDCNNSCQIEYNGESLNVKSYCKSDSYRWLFELSSMIHEQIERTLTKNWSSTSRIWTRSLFYIVLAFCLVFPLCLSFGPHTVNFLTKHDRESLLAQSGNVNSSDKKIEFLFGLHQMQLKNVSERPFIGLPKISNLVDQRILFMEIPLLIIVGCVIYLFNFCYPKAVFLWGDWETYYEQIKSRRELLWRTVILTIILGILTSLFVFGFSEFF